MKKRIMMFFMLMLFLCGCSATEYIVPADETKQPTGNEIITTGDALSCFEDSIENLDKTISMYVTPDTLDAEEVTSAVSRRINYAKKTYDMCNIKGCKMTTTRNDNYSEIEIEIKYYMSKDEYDYVNTRVDTLSKRLQGDNDYETYKNIYQWVCEHVSYDYDTASGLENRFSAYNALKDGKAVCYGYAALYQKFCDTLELPCMVLTSVDDTAHAWNVVQLEGKYYHVDTTFGANTGTTDWNYFLCGQDKITYGSAYGIKLAATSYDP